jgi:catechol 2,3-dioxygenase-like lactoylglutathione lyase family enzyme
MSHPDLLGIIVRDMPTSLRFYRLLGLEFPPDAEQSPHVEVTLPGGFRLAWDTQELMQGIHPTWVEPAGHRMALAFLCAGPAEVDDLYHRIVAAGYTGYRPPWDAFWGQRYAVVLDPDENLIDLFAPLPGAA